MLSRLGPSTVTFLNVIFYNIYNFMSFILNLTECYGFNNACMNKLSGTFWNRVYMHFNDTSNSYFFY